MADEKHEKLINKLNTQTQQEKLNWEISIDESGYQVAFSEYTVKISNVPTKLTGTGSDIKISIYNDMGTTIEEFTDVDLDGDSPSDRPYFRMMTSLYNRVRRIALGSDKAINSILSELGDDD